MNTLVHRIVPRAWRQCDPLLPLRLDGKQPGQDLPSLAAKAQPGNLGQRGRLRVHLHDHTSCLSGQEGQGSGGMNEPAGPRYQADFRSFRRFYGTLQNLGIEPFTKPHDVRA